MMDVAVFHPGTQHSWQTATALQELDRLAWYATSIFYQPDRLPYALEKVLPGPLRRRAHAEFRRFSHPALDPAKVRTSGLAEWAERIAVRAGQRKLARRIDRFGNRRFVSAIAREIAGDDAFALWGYNGSSRGSFELARAHGRPCILDRTNGDFGVYNAMMEEVRARYGEWFLDAESPVPDAVIADDHAEYRLADRIVVGSEFAAGTIRQAAPEVTGRLEVLRYCYDEALFAGLPPPAPVPRDRPVRFLWAGLVIPRKGIQHVLEAIDRIPASGAELTIVGDLKLPRTVFARYADRVRYIPTVARADIPRIMAAHDVFLLPSYFEGAGITLYEALASGCALIQSDRCADAVTPQTGLMIGEPTTDKVHDAMLTAIEDRERLNAWRGAAQDSARAYTFARYRDGIAALLADMGL